MQEKSFFAIDQFTQAVTRLVIDKDGIEGTPTPDIEAALLTLPPVWDAIGANPDWHQIMPLRRAVTATEALLTTLTVIHEEHNQAIVIEWALAWGVLQSRLDAATRFINEQQPPPDVSNNRATIRRTHVRTDGDHGHSNKNSYNSRPDLAWRLVTR